jgi:hypothetical protein
MKHSHYEYEVYEDFEASYNLADRDPEISSTRWVYTIYLNDPERKLCVGDDTLESDEWFAMEEEAIKAACHHIDCLE